MIAQAAAAAFLVTSQACYVEDAGRVAFGGSGFAPGSPVEVSLDGRRVGTVPASPSGTISGGRIPAPSAGGNERLHLLTASDPAGNEGAVRFRTTVTSAKMFPANPSGTRVRFRVRGFPTATPSVLYLHYVAPGGRRSPRTVALDAPRPPCGTMLTRPSTLLPFRAGPGTWRLQLDLRPRWLRRPPPPAASIALPVVRAR